MSFELYGNHPWVPMGTTKREEWYDPILANAYVRDSIYSQYVKMGTNPVNWNASEYVVTDLIPPRPTPGVVDNRQMWTTSQNFDTFNRRIGFVHRMGKLAFHEFDAMMTYLRQNGGGLPEIVSRHMAPMIN